MNDFSEPTNLAPSFVLGFVVVFLTISFLVTIVQHKRERQNVAETGLFDVSSNSILIDSESMEAPSPFDHSPSI